MCGTSRNFIDYASSKLGRKTPSTTPPPLEFTELHRLPPLEIGPENSFNCPPSNSQNFIDYPPSKSGRKTPSTTPPSNSRNFIDYLFRLRSWWNALERCLESVPTVKNSHFNHWADASRRGSDFSFVEEI